LAEVKRDRITMTGEIETGSSAAGRLIRLCVTVTGLERGEAASVGASGTYRITWTCGMEPAPCGELGCVPSFMHTIEGAAETTARAVAGSDGTIMLEITLVAAPPADTCSTDAGAPWGEPHAESWRDAMVTDAEHGVRLTPPPIE
jgi:hypothetical protein